VKQFFAWMCILMRKLLSTALLHTSFFQLMFSPCDRTAVCVHYEEEHCREPTMTSECSSFFDLQGAAQFHSRWGNASKHMSAFDVIVTKLQRCNVPHKNQKISSWWNNISQYILTDDFVFSMKCIMVMEIQDSYSFKECNVLKFRVSL